MDFELVLALAVCMQLGYPTAILVCKLIKSLQNIQNLHILKSFKHVEVSFFIVFSQKKTNNSNLQKHNNPFQPTNQSHQSIPPSPNSLLWGSGTAGRSRCHWDWFLPQRPNPPWPSTVFAPPFSRSSRPGRVDRSREKSAGKRPVGKEFSSLFFRFNPVDLPTKKAPRSLGSLPLFPAHDSGWLEEEELSPTVFRGVTSRWWNVFQNRCSCLDSLVNDRWIHRYSSDQGCSLNNGPERYFLHKQEPTPFGEIAISNNPQTYFGWRILDLDANGFQIE